jgi:hypothetical protein
MILLYGLDHANCARNVIRLAKIVGWDAFSGKSNKRTELQACLRQPV